jgi:resuscitation-promoting factor RpfB
MFSYPLASPLILDEKLSFEIAYLSAVSPYQSATSRYRVYVMDQDGSEPTEMFPQESSVGLQPQRSWGAWSPDPKSRKLALIYEGDLWLLDVVSGGYVQVTGDGLTTTLDWK